MITKDELIEFVSRQEEIEAYAERVLHAYLTIKHGRFDSKNEFELGGGGYIDRVTITDTKVLGFGYEPWQYGDPTYYEMPLHFLYEADALERYRAERIDQHQQELIEKAKQEKAQKEKAKLEREKHDQEEWERLQKKFGGKK